MSTIQERVEAGASWLDANRPGWVDRINLETLHLELPCHCVLGQEFGDFGNAPEEIWTAATEHGFDALAPVSELEYDELTDAWCDYITARRAAA